jgi:dolichol-phosphate mannosyltransferase
MAGKSVAILLPTYNEEEGIGGMIDRIRAVSSDWRIIVVDSGSKDGTIKIAKQKGAEIIQLGIRGKGIAIKKAFEEVEDDYVVQIDSDLTYQPEQIPLILEKLKGCDVAMGSRFSGNIEEGAMPGLNRVGNQMLSVLASVLYMRRVTDVCSGLWGFTKKAYKSMNITAIHFELECDMFAECAKRGFRICEIPIDYKRRAGETKLSPIYGFIDSWQLLKKRF